jgi:hypothetical protein
MALSASPCSGQARPGGGADSLCTYAACALRLRGNTIVAGTEGRAVGSFGFFSPPQLRPWIEVSDSASAYLRLAEASYTSGQVLSLVGMVTVIAGVVVSSTWHDDAGRAGALAAQLGGFTALAIGGRRVGRARDAVQTAIWWYNGALAGSPVAPRTGPRPTVQELRLPASAHGGRNGLILGSLAGLGVGLAVSARHPASETTQGVLETLGIGAVGAFIGWRIGVAR